MDSSAPAPVSPEAVSFFETHADEILSPTVIPTGIAALDRLLGGGLRSGGLTVLVAGTAVGKSALAAQIACGAAVFALDRALGPVLFMSYESSALNLARRMVAQTADLRDGFSSSGVSRRDEPAARAALVRLARLPIRIEEDREIGVAGVEKAITNSDPSVVVVDYLGLMGADGEDDKADLGDKVRALKVLTMERNVAMLLVAQLSRSANRPDALPTLRDISVAAIEQHADTIMLLHRPSAFRPRHIVEQPDYAEDASTLAVAKSRFAQAGLIEMMWNASRARFDFGA